MQLSGATHREAWLSVRENERDFYFFDFSELDAAAARTYFERVLAESMQLCGIGVAVETAIPEVKSVADEIAESNDEDGVARWIEEHLF